MIQTVSLISLLEGQNEEEPDAVKLTTLHASKGLEYPLCFLISCEEGILPHQESIAQGTIEEERRLMYVGITRAQYELTISYCEQRRKAGAVETRERSRFWLNWAGITLLTKPSVGLRKLMTRRSWRINLIY